MPPVHKQIQIGPQTFTIAGVSNQDPYFASLSDTFEPEFELFCQDFIHDDDICIDIGANIGLKSLMLSQHVPRGRVIAIEAAPTVAAILERNIADSACSNITIVKTAIGDHDGRVNFTDASAYGHISPSGIEVPLRTLPSLAAELALPRLDFVKLDVEGYEFPILQNSLDLLNRHQSLIHLEFNAWCQISKSGVNPRTFAEWIFANFTDIMMVRPHANDAYLQRLPTTGAIDFLHTNLVKDATLTDLLVTNAPHRLRPKPRRDTAIVKKLTAARDTARAERDTAIAERDAALAEIAALHNSTSWKLSSPVRVLGETIKSRRR